jgi:uncharacterized membrane protein YeaQ/YmgE (transglycosylase-associated protein family)
MTTTELIIMIIIAFFSGSIGASLAGSRKGCFASIALGFIGSFIGTMIAKKFDLPVIFVIPVGGQSFPIIWAIMGAAVFVAVLGLVGGGRKD